MTKANVLDMFHGDNKEHVPDFKALKEDGIIAVLQKITQGTREVDPTFVVRSRAAAEAGMPFYAYHFNTREDPAAQAKHFLSVLPTGVNVLGGALDFEKNAKYGSMTLAGAKTFLKICDDALGFPIPIYGGDQVREIISPVHSEWPFFAKRMLWLAEYGPHERIPLPWRDASKALWQFSESGTEKGMVGHVDLNIWPGTAEELHAAWKGDFSPPVPAAPEKPPEARDRKSVV